eukprot:603481-Hanusia_phi.AAC.1
MRGRQLPSRTQGSDVLSALMSGLSSPCVACQIVTRGPIGSDRTVAGCSPRLNAAGISVTSTELSLSVAETVRVI